LAHAGADIYGVGNAKDGNATISGVINRYTTMTQNANAGSTTLHVGSASGLAMGDIILIAQSTGYTGAVSGAQGSISLNGNRAGQYELAQITALGGTTLTLDSGLLYSYTAADSQVVRVPQYKAVTINGTVSAQAWNGQTGGIVAFLATQAVTNNGSVSASGAGFRGGVLANATGGDQNGDFFGCSENDAPTDRTFGTNRNNAVTYDIDAWAQKGEGLVTTSYGTGNAGRGRGNYADGAGGGDCDNSGGGGGSNAAQGGQGGDTWAGDGDGSSETCNRGRDGNCANANNNHVGRSVGGLGGAPLTMDMTNHLVFGGGGGAGEENGSHGGAGGAGGGIVFIRAKSLSGGSISANGAAGSNSTDDGAGGGGAGGSVYLGFEGTCQASAISVSGGNGGTVNFTDDHGPGGGGSAGRIYLASQSGSSCSTILNPGSNGTWNGVSKSATPAGSTPATALTKVGPLTAVTLLHFGHAPAKAGEEITWETGSERGTIGFYIRRESKAGPRVSPKLIAGQFDSPSGGRYQLVDPKGRSSTTYYLEEIARDGVHFYGPAKAERSNRWSLRPARSPMALPSFVEHFRTPRTPTRRPSTGGAAYARVEHEGIYAIDAAALSAVGINPRVSLQLSREGRSGPLFQLPGGGWFFYAAPVDAVERAQDAYAVTPGMGMRAPVQAAAPTFGTAVPSFADSLQFQGHTFLDPAAEPAYRFPWAMAYSGSPPVSVEFDAPTLLSASSITFELRGLVDFPDTTTSHHVRISLNGTQLIDSTWNGDEEISLEASLPAGLIRPTGNELAIAAPGDLGMPYDLFALGAFEVTGQHAYVAQDDALGFTAPSSSNVEVTGFSAPPVLLDVTDARRPVLLQHTQLMALPGGGFGVRFHTRPGSSEHRYFAAVPRSPELKSSRAAEVPSGSADYVVIAGPGLGDSLAPLLAAREAQGLSTLQVDAEAVYDAVGFGDHGPEAIHRYLSQLSPPPKYVLLVGKPSVDPHDYLQTGIADLVPTTLPFEAGWARFAVSDAPLVAGPDGRTPFTAIGRLPVSNATQLDAWVQKLVGQSQVPGNASRTAAWIADAEDPATGNDDPFFRSESDRLIPLLPGLQPTRVYMPSAEKSDLFAALRQSPDLVVYHGHGDALDWSQAGLLTSGDLSSLPPVRPFMLVTVDCYDGMFAQPNLDPLTQQLAELASGGAVAAFAASTLVDQGIDPWFDDAVFPELSRPGLVTVGDFTLAAQRNLAALGGAGSVLLLDYNLIGDPASPLPLR